MGGEVDEGGEVEVYEKVGEGGEGETERIGV